MLTMPVISVSTEITGIADVAVSGVLHAAAKEVVVDMAKRPAALDHANRMDWVERVTSFCTEQWGLPPITGRILGWLMICDPAEQSAGQIAEAIGASRASLTANIRQLTAAGFVRRQSRAGERTAYFWIDDDAWERVLHNRFASMAAFKNIARDGMELAGPRSAQAARMQSAYDAFDWLARLVDASPKPPEPKRSNP